MKQILLGWFILFALADGGNGLPSATVYGPFDGQAACSQNLQTIWQAFWDSRGGLRGVSAVCYWDGNGTP
jgi:hypothetical protein